MDHAATNKHLELVVISEKKGVTFYRLGLLNALWNKGHISLRVIIPIMYSFMTQDTEITRKIDVK